MPNCRNCGAALTDNSLFCPYCKTRQDVDLTTLHKYTTEKPETERICPRCRIPMKTINLVMGKSFLIERCEKCLGIFFDPGELEALVDKTVTNVYVIDHQRMEELHTLKRSSDYPVAYIKCPVCGKLMNRINFGARSGVIIDTCRDHGVWLDGGELRQLLEWTKAGGELYTKEKQLEMERIQLAEERRDNQYKIIDTASTHWSPEGNDTNGIDLLGMIGRILTRIF